MPLTLCHDPTLHIQIHSTQEIFLQEYLFKQFIDALTDWNRIVPLKSYQLNKIEDSPMKYTHRTLTKDERSWNQELLFNSGIDEVAMTFDAKSYWKMAELTGHHAVKMKVVALIGTFGVTRIEANWN